MNCRRAQTNIALWSGNDLDETDRESLLRHLEACPECREYKAEMQALMQLVDECPLRDEGDEASKSAVADSLWPSLSSRLVSLPSPRSDRFNGWIPAVAVAAVCLAMLIVASPPEAFSPSPQGTQVPAGESAWSESEASGSTLASSPAEPREQMIRPPITGMQVDDRQMEVRRFGFSSEWNGRIPEPPAVFKDDQGPLPQREFRGFPFDESLENHPLFHRPPMIMFIVE